MFSKRCSGKIYVYQNKSRKIKKKTWLRFIKKTFDWGFWEQNWKNKLHLLFYEKQSHKSDRELYKLCKWNYIYLSRILGQN